MSRIITKMERLLDFNGNLIDEYVRRRYFKTKLDTKVEIEVKCGFSNCEIVFIPDKDDFFCQETLYAIVRYLRNTGFYITEKSDSVELHISGEYIEGFIEELAYQVDLKLDVVLKEKGIDPNAKNYAIANEIEEELYDGHFKYDIYADIRNMYSYDDEEVTELIENLDDSVFSESIEEIENDEL